MTGSESYTDLVFLFFLSDPSMLWEVGEE